MCTSERYEKELLEKYLTLEVVHSVRHSNRKTGRSGASSETLSRIIRVTSFFFILIRVLYLEQFAGSSFVFISLAPVQACCLYVPFRCCRDVKSNTLNLFDAELASSTWCWQFSSQYPRRFSITVLAEASRPKLPKPKEHVGRTPARFPNPSL